ncbi:hypothetical protein ACQ4PT_049147 [Festuca glaucescens]
MGEEAAVVLVEAPRPRSPPRYPDMCGRRRMQLEVQILDREITFLKVSSLSLSQNYAYVPHGFAAPVNAYPSAKDQGASTVHAAYQIAPAVVRTAAASASPRAAKETAAASTSPHAADPSAAAAAQTAAPAASRAAAANQAAAAAAVTLAVPANRDAAHVPAAAVIASQAAAAATNIAAAARTALALDARAASISSNAPPRDASSASRRAARGSLPASSATRPAATKEAASAVRSRRALSVPAGLPLELSNPRLSPSPPPAPATMSGQEAPGQLHSPAGTDLPTPQQRPPLPAATPAGGGRSRSLRLAFLCLAVSMAAAWFVEPFAAAAAAAELPASAVAATVLLLAACFHGTIHLAHSFAAPRRPPAFAAAPPRRSPSPSGSGSRRAFTVPGELPRSTYRPIAD